MPLEDFKNLAAGIQSLLVGVAVLIAGAWTLFRFFSLKEVNKAKAELEKAKRELQQRGQLRVEMRATQIFSSDRAEKYINVSLIVTNLGNRTEVIRWRDSRFSAALVSKGADGALHFGDEIHAHVHSLHVALEASTIDPGVSDTYAFLISVESEGVYFVESSLAGSPAETATAIDAISVVASKPDLAYWGASMYVSVAERTNESPDKTMQAIAPGGG
jgi:hypothetical protein